jgi:hypothetical protein
MDEKEVINEIEEILKSDLTNRDKTIIIKVLVNREVEVLV